MQNIASMIPVREMMLRTGGRNFRAIRNVASSCCMVTPRTARLMTGTYRSADPQRKRFSAAHAVALSEEASTPNAALLPTKTSQASYISSRSRSIGLSHGSYWQRKPSRSVFTAALW